MRTVPGYAPWCGRGAPARSAPVPAALASRCPRVPAPCEPLAPVRSCVPPFLSGRPDTPAPCPPLLHPAARPADFRPRFHLPYHSGAQTDAPASGGLTCTRVPGSSRIRASPKAHRAALTKAAPGSRGAQEALRCTPGAVAGNWGLPELPPNQQDAGGRAELAAPAGLSLPGSPGTPIRQGRFGTASCGRLGCGVGNGTTGASRASIQRP